MTTLAHDTPPRPLSLEDMAHLRKGALLMALNYMTNLQRKGDGFLIPSDTPKPLASFIATQIALRDEVFLDFLPSLDAKIVSDAIVLAKKSKVRL